MRCRHELLTKHAQPLLTAMGEMFPEVRSSARMWKLHSRIACHLETLKWNALVIAISRSLNQRGTNG